MQTQGLGMEYARRVAQGGCKVLVLTSRSGTLNPTELLTFASLGVSAFSIQCQSADASSSARVLEWVHETLACVQHYVHAAGVSSFALMQDMSNVNFNDICGPKVRFFYQYCHSRLCNLVHPQNQHGSGSCYVDHRSHSVLPEVSGQVVGTQVIAKCGVPCDSILLFSSTSSIWSQPGSSHYSSANTYLDKSAQQMQYAGIPALAIQYGPFAEVGMASKHVDALLSIGVHSLRPEEVQYSLRYG